MADQLIAKYLSTVYSTYSTNWSWTRDGAPRVILRAYERSSFWSEPGENVCTIKWTYLTGHTTRTLYPKTMGLFVFLTIAAVARRMYVLEIRLHNAGASLEHQKTRNHRRFTLAEKAYRECDMSGYDKAYIKRKLRQIMDV